MLIRRQDIGVLFFYYCGYSKIRNLIFRLQRKPVARFIAFHDIPFETLNRFEGNLNFLKRKTNIISLEDFMFGRLSVEKINVVITFDDGYKSWINHAVPILRQLALPATFFISSGFVGLSKEDESAFIQSHLLLHHQRTSGGLTYDDVKRIADQGFTIGGHTLNHRNLSALNDNIGLKYEIAEDKSALEKLTGAKIDYFAYPLGFFHNPHVNIIEILKESGYKGAVTTVSGLNTCYTNPFLLHRELTGASMPASVFKARVYGNYDAVKWLKQIIQFQL